MTENQGKIRIGITHGDYNGISYEVILKSLSNKEITELYTPVIFGSGRVAAETIRQLKIEDFKFRQIDKAANCLDGHINLVDVVGADVHHTPGHASEKAGAAAVAALEAASKALEDDEIDLLVTAPIDKKSAQGDLFRFPGHTEYLEEKFVVDGGKALMIMAEEGLRVALVTTHIPLRDVAAHITKENVERAIIDFAQALKMDFGCERPKIAVLGLNPHCGDGGMLGTEEAEAILPAVEACRDKGILAFGPLPADGLFGSGAFRNYDGILAMYHDQGLAPFKALSRSGGVNFTAGLNIIRTSPAHGTAYDKAGKGIADETSMREAIYMAVDIARRRAKYIDASENPLVIREVKPREPKRVKPFNPNEVKTDKEEGEDMVVAEKTDQTPNPSCISE